MLVGGDQCGYKIKDKRRERKTKRRGEERERIQETHIDIYREREMEREED